MEEGWAEFLRPIVVKEMERLEHSKNLELKCEERATRIGNMFDERLSILSRFR
jgi:hypothetical protein